MTPPEVILDRWVKSHARPRVRGCKGYVGKLNLDEVDPPPLGSLLSFVQETMNTALRAESANASGGVDHPPFHFDYIQVSDGTKNAHAFQHDGCSFIVVTQPLIELLWAVSGRLARSPRILQLLGVKGTAARTEGVHALFFQLQLTFLVSHEYTHHVHRHCGRDQIGEAGLWTEFAKEELDGAIDRQARELDADAYAIYLVLSNFIRGGGRKGALVQLGRQHLPDIDADSLILTCFFVAVIAFFGELWPEDIRVDSIWQLTHPPAPVRIDFAIRVARMWSGQNECVSESWFGAERLQEIFEAVLSTYAGAMRQGWDAHVAFFRGEEGIKYNRRLLDSFDTLRKMGGAMVVASTT